ncbi:MAG: RagB/SusD family nutrient uptake outer membrane protein, partial [Tannerella sp.]|nr:RagB/SusD family nutrient uptake outer membrane protein [Tannerella sp.]
MESENYSEVSSSLYPTTERDAFDLVTGNAYAGFQNNDYNGAFNAATGFHLLGDMATDFGLCSWGEGDWGPLEYANFQNPDGARNPRRNWEPYLPWISKMELTIDRIKGIEMNEDLKRRYIAELECGQGFMAFLIWDFYGPVIVADLETLKNPQAEIILPRQTNDQTIAYIESKLKAGIGILEKSYDKGDTDYGRFTEGLCHILLLKLYMQTHQWDKAITEGRELMKPEYGYELVTEAGSAGSAYANIFTSANEGNKETIWAVNCLREYQSHLWYPHVVSWGGYKMTRDFYDTFEEGDQRTQVILDTDVPAGVLPLKYDMVDRVGDNCYTDWIVYRYADAITLLAEALVHKDGSVSQEAVDLLNRVRTRAGLTAFQLTDFQSTGDFIDKLLWERAHELWYEGCRRQDLIRNNKYVEIMSKKCITLGKTDYISGLGTNAHLFPLPSSAVNEGKKGG